MEIDRQDVRGRPGGTVKNHRKALACLENQEDAQHGEYLKGHWLTQVYL